MEERKRCFPTAIKLKFNVRMSTRRYMNPVVRRNHESRSTHSDGLRSTLKWLRSRILFIIREWTHGSKPIAARDFDWRQIVNNSLRNVQWRCFVLALLASAFLSHVLIKFSYLFAVFFLWMFFVHFLLFMFVCFKKVDFFFYRSIYVEVIIQYACLCT